MTSSRSSACSTACCIVVHSVCFIFCYFFILGRLYEINSSVLKRNIWTHLDLLSIPQSEGKNVKTFRWDHRLQRQSLFMPARKMPATVYC